MTRALAIYVLILNFFLLLIVFIGVYIIVSRHSLTIGNYRACLTLLSAMLCPVCSIIYVISTWKSKRLLQRKSLPEFIDDMQDMENQYDPISNKIKVCGFAASTISVCIAFFTAYSVTTEYFKHEIQIRNEDIMVFVVIFFNAICQPWYVWKTFHNVKIQK